MPFRPRRLPALLLVSAVAALTSGSAEAATQTKLDEDGWPRNDLLSATWDVTPTTAALTFEVDTNDFGDWLYFFLDTDRDGRSDFAVDGSISGSSDGSGYGVARMRLVTTPQSTTTCQVARGTDWSSPQGGNVTLQEFADQSPQVIDTYRQRYTISFATSLIGGAQRFDWAAYANTFSFSGAAFDYMPDAANADPDRPNPVAGQNDTCDVNGDGVYGSGNEDGSVPDAQDGFVPLRMSEGFAFPDDVGAGDPGAGGGAPGGGAPGGTPNPGPGAPAVIDPWAGWTTTNTTRTAPMPKVTGLPADTAKERILRTLGYADFDVREVNVARPPKGAGFTDVIEQTPKAGAPLTAAVGTLPKITLEVYAGPRPVGRKDCMDSLVRDLRGMEYTQALDLLKKAGCKPQYDFKRGSGSQATVTKVTPKAADRVELQVTVPSDPRKNDLFLSFRESPNQLSFDAADWKLTADRDQRNFLTFQVVDRAGRFVQRANVRFDTTDVGAPADPSVAVTDAHGERSTSLLAPKAGRVDVLVWAVGANDVAIYGTAQLQVKDRDAKAGATFTTTSGRTLQLGKAGRWAEIDKGSVARAAQSQTPFQRFLSWITGLVGGAPSVQAAQASGGSAQAKVNKLSTGPKVFPSVLAAGGEPIGTPAKLIGTASGNVVSGGGANVVSAGGANLIGSAAGNVVSGGGGNLATVAAEGRLAIDPGKLISDARTGVVSAGGGNVVSAGGANIIGSAAGNLISDNGLGLQFAGAGNGLIGPAAGNLLSDNGLG